MFEMDASLTSALSHYPSDCQPTRAEVVASSGFSGAKIWRLETDRGVLCLRRWSLEHPDVERLKWMHAVLRHVGTQCGNWIAVPIATQSGATFAQADGHLWELTPWLPGSPALVNEPTQERVAAAMAALAQFHLAAATFPQADQVLRPAPGIGSRHEQLTGLLHGGIERLRTGVEEAHAVWPSLAEAGLGLLKNFSKTAPPIERMLLEVSGLSVTNQPCIRDIHCEHILFTENEVTGMVDFGAMRTDHVTGDIARLLGSVAEADSDLWVDGLAAYERFRRLSSAEHRLLKAYHASAAVLSGVNWLQWVFLQRREFADRAGVERRFAAIAGRLARMAGRNEPLAV